ncbi:hypothetical protein FDECE_3482 [Fusarium decemcellulare]|nr:hypothetical protein FDECE_3482 [Fusarium decemcellulare]
MVRRNGAEKSSISQSRSKISLGGQFHFISIQNPDDAKDRTATRSARSHAVARGIEAKRKLQQKSGHNFRVTVLKDDPSRPASEREPSQSLVASPCSFTACAPGPFQMLAAESPRLYALLSGCKAQQATGPIFDVSDELVLQNFRTVLRKGRDDDALLSAIMVTFAFAVAPGSIGREFLGYQSEALSSIRRRISSPAMVPSESTLGAILLLAGIEVCTTFFYVPKSGQLVVTEKD